jgi:hypothetical protein
MKLQKYICLASFFLVFSSLFGQTLPREKWPQFKLYSKLLIKTYHDAEAGNLETLKKESLHLFEKAEAITNETVPEDLNTTVLLENLVVLRRETKMVNELIRNQAPDEKIMKVFTKLNNTYQQILGMIQPEND